MYKKILLLFSIFIFFLNLVNGYYYATYEWCDENGVPLTGVKMIGWQCKPRTSSLCDDVRTDRPFVIDTLPISSGVDNIVRTNFVNPVENGDYYIWYAYKEGYQATFPNAKLRLYQHTGSATFWFDKTCEEGYKLYRKDYCSATFTPTITSCAEAGLPISILTDTELNLDTQSAFNYPGIYWPPELDDWKSVDTQMDIDIKKVGGASSVFGYPQNQNIDIVWDETHNFNFLWQTSVNTDPGDYIVTITSTVPDAKCDQTNIIPVEKTITVHISPSLDGCVAQLQNFASTSNPDINVEMTFTGTHVNTYQNWSYDSISACEAENAVLEEGKIFNTDYTLTIKKDGSDYATLTDTLSSNDDYNTPKSFSIEWTPTEHGSYEAILEIESTGSVSQCAPGTTTATASTTFTIGHDNGRRESLLSQKDMMDGNKELFLILF